jgi:hypothetical protein
MNDKNPFEKFTGKLVRCAYAVRLEVGYSGEYDRILAQTIFFVLDTSDVGTWFEENPDAPTTWGFGVKVLTAEGVFETQEVIVGSLTIVETEDEESNTNDG